MPPAAAKAVNSSNPARTLSVLFPANQDAAKANYVKDILSYPGFYLPSASVKSVQNAALAQWFAGRQPAGRKVTNLHLPTLVADGTDDALDPVRNDRMLASLIPKAQLAIYPDAGHAFWFQDQASSCHGSIASSDDPHPPAPHEVSRASGESGWIADHSTGNEEVT